MARLEVTKDSALAAVTDLIVDSKGNYLVADGVRLNGIWVFSPQGRYLGRLGGPGQGPGEYSSPLSLAVGIAGELFVNDYFSMKIIVFDRDYRYLREIKRVRGQYLHINARNDLFMYEGMISAVPRGVFDTIKRIDAQGRITGSFAPIPESVLKTRFGKLADGMDIDRRGLVYEMNPLLYQVRIYADDGRPIGSFTNPKIRTKANGADRELALIGPYCLDPGMILVQRQSRIDVFDSGGNLLLEGIPFPPLLVHSRGDVFYGLSWEEQDRSEATPNPIVRGYRLKPTKSGDG